MQVERRTQPSASTPAPQAAPAAHPAEASAQHPQSATQALKPAAQKQQDAFNDVGHLLSHEQVAQKKGETQARASRESGDARQALRDARQSAKGKAKTSEAKGVAPAKTSAKGGDPVDRLIDYTARNEGGGRYDAWNPNDNGAGVSFGLIQYNQKRGSLPTVIHRMAEKDPAKFNEIFGANAAHMRNADWVRHANLNDPTLKSQMLKAGRDPEFQRVQRDVAREGYFNPAARVLKKYGLKSERAHAMAFDLSVQYGVGGMEQKLAAASRGGGGEKAILRRLADLGDTHGYDANRRHRILNDSHLSDGPMGSAAPKPPEKPAPKPAPAPSHPAPAPAHFHWPELKKGSKSESVHQLQNALVKLGYMTSAQVATGPGIFGPKTDGAVRRFQAEHRLEVDGVVGPITRGALERALGGKGTPAPAPKPHPSPAPPPVHPGKYDGSRPAKGTTDTRAWIPASPPLTNAAGHRSATNYAQTINQFAVGANPRYTPRNGSTYCNIFVWDVTKAMGAEIPHWVNGKGDPVGVGKGRELSANGVVGWLHQYGSSHGWHKVSAQEAQRRANEGAPATVVWNNPGGIGHVAIVRPGSSNGAGPTIAQAGARNVNSTHVGNTFGNRPVEYWVHS